MYVVKPVTITDSNLTSSIPELDSDYDPQEWRLDYAYDTIAGDPISTNLKSASYIERSGEWLFVDGTEVSKTDGEFKNKSTFIDYSLGTLEAVAVGLLEIWVAVDRAGDIYIRSYDFDGNYNSFEFLAYQDDGSTPITNIFDIVVKNDNSVIAMWAPTTTERVFNTYNRAGVVDATKTFTVTGGSTTLNTFVSLAYTNENGGTLYSSKKTEVFSFDLNGTQIASYTKNFTPIDSEIPDAIGIDTTLRAFYIDSADGDAVFKHDLTSLDYKYWQAGDEATLVSTNSVYRCTTDGTFDRPDLGAAKATKTWTKIRSTNKYAMFDGIISNQSINSSPVTITFSALGAIDTVAGFNIDASSVNITMVDPVYGEVHNEDLPIIDNSGVLGWWELFTLPIIDKKQFVATDLPFYPDADITLTFTSADDAGIGEIVIGRKVSLGVAQYGTGFNLLNFNTLTRDEFGTITRTTGRKTADQFNFNIKIQEENNLYFRNTLKDLNDTQCLWMGKGSNDDETIVLGYYRDVVNNWSSPSLHDCTLQIEGVI